MTRDRRRAWLPSYAGLGGGIRGWVAHPYYCVCVVSFIRAAKHFCIYEKVMLHAISTRICNEDGQDTAAQVRACRAYAQVSTLVAGDGVQLGTGGPQNG